MYLPWYLISPSSQPLKGEQVNIRTGTLCKRRNSMEKLNDTEDNFTVQELKVRNEIFYK